MGEKDHSHRALGADAALSFVPLAEFRRVRQAAMDADARVALLADLCRINTLYMIMRAGSGHIGSSFSSTDLITWLWTEELKDPNSGSNGDVYFSSKGHDAPALYSLLIAFEKLEFDLVHRLRQIDGLPGHPDVSTPYIATNTGSLGMGISKAYGMARANRYKGGGGRIFVMTGDGELQEGQIWESLQPVANERLSEITVIVDHNKYQSDTLVSAVSDLGPLEEKFRAFGWEVRRGDGHDPRVIRETLAHFATVTDRPKVFIADTIKGKGVSFMEGIACGDQTYQFHAGAPSLENYLKATEELLDRVNGRLQRLGHADVTLQTGPLPVRVTPAKPEKIVLAYGDELLAIARHRPDIVVLDADLLTDCGIEAFREELPDRFIECGIAEQHMVSAAGGLALRGMLPVVHSFACFLTTRANEHIYNNATERKKIIYVGTLAGLVPAGPGHSHQAVRDISAIGAVPGLIAFEPCNEQEARMAIRWAVEENADSTYLRFVNVPLDLPYALPSDYRLQVGRGARIRSGADAVIVGYGTVLLANAYRAAEQLAGEGLDVAVVDLPWLNRVDEEWVRAELAHYPLVVTLDNHYLEFGQGVMVAAALARTQARANVVPIGLTEIPACGGNADVLEHHGLDADSIARVVRERIGATSLDSRALARDKKAAPSTSPINS